MVETRAENVLGRRPLCSDVSAEGEEPLAGTASRVDHWLLVEYRSLWSRNSLAESLLSERVKAHLTEQLALVRRSRLLFIRRPERRRAGGIVCYVATTRERERSLSRLELGSHENLLDLDLRAALASDADAGSRLDHPLLLVCTHGKRDRCCAVYGRPVYQELREQVDPEWVWQSTHVGGDRFAGNVVFLPDGSYYGRLRREDVWPLLDEQLAGRVYLDRFRGRCCYPFPVQAAERAIRVATGLTGIDDLSVAGTAPKDEGWRVQFHAAPTGELHEVDVAGELGDLTYLTCCAEALRRPRRYVATGHRSRPAR